MCEHAAGARACEAGRVTHAAGTPDFMHSLGLDLWHDNDGFARGRAQIRPTMFVPRSERLRLGVLATCADIVAGNPVDGPINPTIDLRVTIIATPPSVGAVELACRPIKVGRRLFVGEVLAHAEGQEAPFARALATFMNRRVGIASTLYNRPADSQPSPFGSYDEILALRSTGTLDGPIFELENHDGVTNSGGVISGGAQALMAEIAAERVLPAERTWIGIELDIRYLNRLKRGPLVATPERQALLGNDLWVRVPMMERDRIIALSTARFVPADAVGEHAPTQVRRAR